jgi:hypothetical protein
LPAPRDEERNIVGDAPVVGRELARFSQREFGIGIGVGLDQRIAEIALEIRASRILFRSLLEAIDRLLPILSLRRDPAKPVPCLRIESRRHELIVERTSFVRFSDLQQRIGSQLSRRIVWPELTIILVKICKRRVRVIALNELIDDR